MFTLEHINSAHAQVKSGADFAAFFKEIQQLGVDGYDSFVRDGHCVYFGKNDQPISSSAKYKPLPVAPAGDVEKFKTYLKLHQQGGTDYLCFCAHAAETGVEKWSISMADNTCTYYDQAGNIMVVEKIL